MNKILRGGLAPRSIRARLIVTYLVLIVVPLGLLGWFMLQTLDHIYLARLLDDMNVEASLMAESVADDIAAGRTIAAEDLLSHPPPPLRAQARVFLFDKDGQLIATSDTASRNLLGQRIIEYGVSAALAGRSTRGIEENSTAGVPIAYAAQPVLNGDQIIGAIHMDYSLTDIQTAQRELRYEIIVVVIAAGLIASLIGLRLTRGITAPLARLSAAAADIASGDFAHRVPEDAPTELAALARSFNQMAEALQKAEQARQATFANIAHDVRTPLGSIRAAAEALAAGAVDQPDLRPRLLNGLIEHAQYLGRLTDDLLRLAAYEGGGLVLRRIAVDAARLIEQACQGVEAKASANSVMLARNVSASLPHVWADPDRVLEILFNLLDNALRHTPTGGQIRVSVEADAPRRLLWIHICDSGPGIATEAAPHLFERYWRGDYRRSGAGVNMGLGLSIVREIVKAHGGAIAVVNLPGAGADFHFSLPFAPG